MFWEQKDLMLGSSIVSFICGDTHLCRLNHTKDKIKRLNYVN